MASTQSRISSTWLEKDIEGEYMSNELYPVVIEAIAKRLEHARAKHPDWKNRGRYWALGVIHDEYFEFEKAVLLETRERQIDEAFDVIATTIRFILNEMAMDDKEPENTRQILDAIFWPSVDAPGQTQAHSLGKE